MSYNNNFDYSKISYANSKTKLTRKTKKKLDELAEQVALWNQDSFFKKRDKRLRDKIMSSNSGEVILDNEVRKIYNDLAPLSTDSTKVVSSELSSVKKKAAFFESLVAPSNKNNKFPRTFRNVVDTKTSNLLREKVNIVDKVNAIMKTSQKSDLCEKDNLIIKEDAENVPPYIGVSESSSITSHEDSSLTSVSESTFSYKVHVYDNKLFEDFKHVSSLYRSMSISQDIEDCLKEKYNSETESENVVIQTPHKKESKKARRSFSCSESIPRLGDFSVEKNIVENIENQESNHLDKSLQNRDRTLIMLKNEGKFAAKDVVRCMEDVQKILHDPRHHIAGKEYTAACVRLIRSSLVQQSVAERIKSRHNLPCFIEGYLEIENVQLNIKDGFVLINCKDLEKSNRGSDLRRLKKLYHIVLMVRNRGDHSIKSSFVYDIIPKSEAFRLKLPYGSIVWLEVFEYVRFNNLQPEFKFLFELYCMEATPNKYRCNNAKVKYAPLKKFLHQCSSVEKINSPIDNYPSLFFANIGSFVISAKGIRPIHQQHTVNMTVPFDSPFDGNVMFSTKFSMSLTEECKGRLNVYSDVAGTGCWSFYDCELSTTCISGWLSPNNVKPDIILPLHSCLESAKLFQYSVCAKQNSFSIMLDPLTKLPDLPFNRRKSTDGNNKKRFLAAANSYEESNKWCHYINLTRDSLIRWTNELYGE